MAQGSETPELVTYEALDETVMDTVNETGTFQAQDACMLGGCVTGESTHRIDLPVPGPGGLPVHVTLELQTQGGTPILYLDTGDATVYSMQTNRSQDGAEHRIEAVLLLGEDPLAAVITWFGFPPAQETTYTLTGHLMAHHDIAFSGVAVSLPLQPGQHLRLENARSDTPITFIRYTPDGLEANRQASETGVIETTLPGDTRPGDHILLVPPGQPDVRIMTNASEVNMVPVPYLTQRGDPHDVPSGQPVEWTFDTTSTPLAVGLQIERNSTTSFNAGETRATIQAPNGTVLEVQQDCGPFVCFSGGTFTTTYTSQVADPGLDLGTYTVTFEQEAGNEIRVRHVVLGFDL